MNELDGWSAGGDAGRPKRAGWPLDPIRLQHALWSGRRWLIGASVFGVTIGFLLAKLTMGNLWESTAVLRYEGDLQIAGLDGPTWYASGYALEPAAEALHRESFLRKLRDEAGWDVGLIGLRSAIDYETDRRAGTLRISVVDETAEGAAEFAHLVTDVFLDYRRDSQARRIEEEIQRIQDRVEGAEEEVERARRRYDEFREKHGIADLSTGQELMVTSAARIRANSELAALELPALEARVRSLESQLTTMPRTSVLSSGITPEQAAYNQLRQELASARASLSDDHPRVQALQQQVNQLGAQIRAGGGRSGLVGSNVAYQSLESELRKAKSELTALRERQKGLSTLADKAQSRVESFSGIEGEASALLAEVEVQEALIRRLQGTEAALEDALERPTSGFSILERGPIPEFPLPNRMKLVVFGGISMLSVLVALGLVLRRELSGLRVKTPAEVAFWGDGPVLGATAWPIDPSGLDELVAGLDDFAPEATGALLVVAGSPEDSVRTGEFVRRVNGDWFFDHPLRGEQTTHSPPPPPQPVPLTTPPPSGPYPVGGPHSQSAAVAQSSTALALRPPTKLARREEELQLKAWDGPFEGQALRRAARLADRVIVLVRSGAMTCLQLNAIKRRLGRDRGIGYIVTGLPHDLQLVPDRVGNVAKFWER